MTKPASTDTTRRLADFCFSLKYEDLPPPIVVSAKNAILDLLGVALIGSREASARMLFSAAGISGTHGSASVLGTDSSTTPALAALLNGHAAHALDYDDFQHKIGTHISAAVLPAMLAAAELQHSSGREFIAAYVAGFEVGCRLGRAGRFAHHLAKCGVHSTGYLGHFGAAAATGKILDLDVLQMNRCFGITAGHASGVMRSLGTMCKAQNAANAAHNGALAALLAKQGFVGPEDIFDSAQNIFSIFGAKTDPEELLAGLGHQFEISDNTPKVYACSGWRSPIVQASIQIAAANELPPQNIARVIIRASTDVLRFSNYAQPRTGAEAKFSTEYAAAVALADRAGGVEQFDDERVRDPTLADLCQRVKLETDESLKPHQIRVLVKTYGHELSHFIEAQKGDPRNPLRRDELVAKFRANGLAVLPEAHLDELDAMVRGLENVGDIAELTRLCLPGK